MEQATDRIYDPAESWAINAFYAFYEDVGELFDILALCKPLYTRSGKIADLKPDFEKCVSSHHLQSKGSLNGTFDLIFDQTGTIVMTGIFVMLPESRILEFIRSGKTFENQFVSNAAAEVGNLLVGSWDRVFRETADAHEQLSQKGITVGEAWAKPHEYFSFSPADDCLCTVCQVSIDPYPPFKCAAVFPLSILPDSFKKTAVHFPVAASAPDIQQELRGTDQPGKTDSHNTSEDLPLMTEPMQELTPELAETSNEAPAPAATDVVEQPDSGSVQQETAPSAQNESQPQEQPVEGMGPVRQAICELTQSVSQEIPSLSASGMTHSLSARNVMKPAVLWADPEDTVEHVINLLQQHGTGYLLVGRDGQMQGIVSKSDTAAAVSPYLRSVFTHLKRPLDDASLQIRIKWFMSKPVQTIAPDADLDAVIHKMVRYGVRGLPVAGSDGSVLGLITVFDVLAALTPRK